MKHRFKWILPAILLLALVLRGVASLQMSGVAAVCHPSSVTDMATYWRLADDICNGIWPDHFDYQPLYYTLVLPFCRILGGIKALIALQVLLGSLCCLLIGFAASRIWGRRIGAFAALILALARMHLFYTPFALFEVLQSFWIALIFCMALFCWHRNRWWQWLLAALILSCATLTRGNALLFLPGLLLLCCWKNGFHSEVPMSWKRTLALLAAMLLVFELPQLPYAWRNYQYTGRWCGASTAGEKVLALGNTPEAPPGGLEYPLTYSRWVADAERHPSEGRISMVSRIFNWAMQEPVIFAELKWRAALLFWDKQEIANNVSIEHEGKSCCWLKALPSFAITGSLAFMGMLLLCRRIFSSMRAASAADGNMPLVLFFMYMLLCSWFATALFYNLARFRITALPLMSIAAAVALDWLISRGKSWHCLSREAKLSALLLVAISFFWVCGLFGFWQESVEPWVYRHFRPKGLSCNFTDVHLLYDHGPFTVGGFTYLEVPEGGIRIEKRLCLPKDMHITNGKIRLPIVSSAPFAAQLQYNDQVYHLTQNNLIQQRFLTWLEVDIPEITSDIFVFLLPKGIYFGVDTLRRYDRTSFILPSGKKEPFNGEAAVELEY